MADETTPEETPVETPVEETPPETTPVETPVETPLPTEPTTPSVPQLPPDAPTFTTLSDIANMATQFKNDCFAAYGAAADRMNRANRYIKIQDPAFPDDPTKRIWHPNMTNFYSAEDLVKVQALYDQFALEYNFWKTFVVDNETMMLEMFTVTPKLDVLVATAMAAHLRG
jgi:hypothetical protein